MSEGLYLEYGEREIAYLKSRDPVLGAAMDRIGNVRRAVMPDLFVAMVHSVVGQQISAKAHQTVWANLCRQFSPITPETFCCLSPDDLRGCGISARKAGYIQAIAEAVRGGELDLDALAVEPDVVVCRRLCALKGVGMWTAEMLMIFSMRRQDILSRGDFGILKGLRMLYGHREITDELFETYRRRYSPCGTVASLYLWEIAGGACPELADPAAKKAAKQK